MFIEQFANIGFSSVGAACAAHVCRSYGAQGLLSQISINITLLRSEESCVETSGVRPQARRSFKLMKRRLPSAMAPCPQARARARADERASSASN
jgi:hypothetical protein